MKIKLIFTDWRKWDKEKHCSVYNTDIGTELCMGEFHGGTTFDGEIYLNKENEKELTEAIKRGYQPIFYIDISIGADLAYAALQPNTSILRYKEKICQLLLFACKKAYRKHVSDDPSIGWDELGDILCDALCNAMGSDEFVKWNESYSQGFHY